VTLPIAGASSIQKQNNGPQRRPTMKGVRVMESTKISFFNNTTTSTSNQILLFLQPVEAKSNYLFSAWNVLNPSRFSSQYVILSTDFSGSISSYGDTHGNYSSPVGLILGKALEITNPNDQSPVIGLPVDKPLLTPNQVGLLNNTATPAENLSVTWYVNGKKVVETNNTETTTLNPGFTATFELKQYIYCMLGQKPSLTETYTLQSFGMMQQFQVPNGADELNIEVYTDKDGKDKFKLSDLSFNEFVASARRAKAA
jgi:hypothetical protein